MKTLVVVAHPTLEQSSSHQFLLESMKDLENVTVHCISESFDKSNERELVKQHERIVFQFPVYWYAVPSVLKKWFDEVLSHSIGLKGKEFGVIATFGASEKSFQSGGKDKYTVSEMFRPLEMIANHFGMIYLPILSIFQFSYLSQVARKTLLIDVQMYVSGQKNMSFSEKGKWLLEKIKTREQTKNMQHIAQYLEERIDEIDDLTVVLQEVKNGTDID